MKASEVFWQGIIHDDLNSLRLNFSTLNDMSAILTIECGDMHANLQCIKHAHL